MKLFSTHPPHKNQVSLKRCLKEIKTFVYPVSWLKLVRYFQSNPVVSAPISNAKFQEQQAIPTCKIFSLKPRTFLFRLKKPILNPASAVENAHCISAEIRHPLLWMSLIWVWWWDSIPGALGNVELPFIAITPGATLIRSGSTWSVTSMGQIEPVDYLTVCKNDWCSIELLLLHSNT